ncbi:MAG: molybdopterin-binding protein [Bacillota bacterium]
MRKIRVEDAVGLKLCHDITKVIPGEFKGRAFKKGHLIQPEDIEQLKNIGKEHIYIWEDKPGELHEDEAAVRIAEAIAGPNIVFDTPVEGKTILSAAIKGVFRLNSDLLRQLNSIDQVTIPTIPDFYRVERGQRVATARVVPLVIREEKIKAVEELCKEGDVVCQIKPYQKLKVGFIITGNEVYHGRVEDQFKPVLRRKMKYFGAEILDATYCPDDLREIEKAIHKYKAAGAQLIVLTGGMSVDPDDLTPGAIRNTATELVTYGVPVQPGNMFMMAYLNDSLMIGVPGAALYYRTTILDLVLPKIFIGERFTKGDFAAMGEGGLCMTCAKCTYPICYFGRSR